MKLFKKATLEKINQAEKQILHQDLEANINQFKTAFHFPKNKALNIRELQPPGASSKIALLYIEGASDSKTIESHIIEPLLENNDKRQLTEILQSILTTTNGKKLMKMDDCIQDLINGSTIILLEKEDSAISIDTVGFENRSISEPTIEQAFLGSKAAFIESAAANRSLIRKQIRDSNLINEEMRVGDRVPMVVSILYIEGIADDTVVDRIKKRIKQIKTDTILEISVLEEHLEERPYSLFPSILLTERPDRAASFLMEGHIVLLMENSPGVLIAPTTFWALFQTVEDQYLRTLYGSFSRIIRLLSLLIALLTPSFYLAVTTFHPEMLPTDLLLAISASRELVPFPIIWEILFMEITFEILREAGIRIPTPLGPTIGIVGALILGQAAVQASIVSPILVIVVAITGLASFTIPNISLNIGIRILRFVFLLVTHFLGYFGLSLALAVTLAYLVSIKSFGVPFFTPLAPHFPSSKDLVIRPPVWKQWLRPFSTSTVDKQRAKKPEGDL